VNKVEIFVRHDAELDAFGYFQYIHESDPDAALRFLKRLIPLWKDWRFSHLKAACDTSWPGLKNIRSWRVEDFETT